MLINPIHNSSCLCNSFIQGGHIGLLVHSTVVQFNMVIAPSYSAYSNFSVNQNSFLLPDDGHR